MTGLRSVAYVSTAVREMTEFELEALLMECRALNLESEVTGMLLYSRGGFMQCFEGNPEAVDLTYERIRGSRKHRGIIELADEPVESRSFPDFQMGFVHAARSEALKVSTAIWQSRIDLRQGASAGSSGLAALRTFWNQSSPLF